MGGEIRIGTSGWRYAEWRGRFYPRGLPQRRELEYLASRLSTVEINGSFYSLQRPSSYQRWVAATPEDFRFAVKGSRFLTHMLGLRGVDQALANFLASGVLALGHRLGPLLWQLPERLAFDADLLHGFLAKLPRTTAEAAEWAARHDERLDGRAWLTTDEDRRLRHVLEPRHPSYASPEAKELLRRHDVGLVVADTAGRFPLFDQLTTDLVYVRLHGDTELYRSRYSDEALDRWASRLEGWAADGRDVVVYFDNDAEAHAPSDAIRLAERLGLGTGPDPGLQ